LWTKSNVAVTIFFPGPVYSIRCQNCRKNVSVSWLSIGLTLPVMLIILKPAIWFVIIFTTVIVALYLFLYIKWIPLVKQ